MGPYAELSIELREVPVRPLAVVVKAMPFLVGSASAHLMKGKKPAEKQEMGWCVQLDSVGHIRKHLNIGE